MESLALKYRPRVFSDMVGQKLTAVVLDQMEKTASVPHALLFSGPSGTGKTTAARILASRLNPTEADAIEAGTSVSVTEIDSASRGGVADIRTMMESLRYQSFGDNRVVIYDECHRITRDGWDALLKPTEEESGVYFIFVTTEPEQIPVTSISRLTEFPFRSVSIAEVFERLTFVAATEKLSVSDQLRFDIASRSGGNIRSALTALDQVSRAHISSPQEYADFLGDFDIAPTLLSAMLTGDASNFFSVLDTQLTRVGNPNHISAQLVRCLRDILVLRSGGDLLVTGPALESRKDLATRIDADRVLAAVRILWDLKTRIKGTEDARGNLELALMLVSEVFTRGNTPVVRVSQPAPQTRAAAVATIAEKSLPRKLSLSDIQQRK